MGEPALKLDDRFTYKEYKTWPEDEVDTVVEPDLIVVCDPAKVKRNGIHGAPDWVLEVLHPDTLDLLIYRLDSGRFGAPFGATLKSPVEVGLFPGLVLGPGSP